MTGVMGLLRIAVYQSVCVYSDGTFMELDIVYIYHTGLK